MAPLNIFRIFILASRDIQQSKFEAAEPDLQSGSVSDDVKIGGLVYEGQILGETGKSGTAVPHLHIDVKDRKGNPKDPEDENYGSLTNEEFFMKYNGDYKALRKSKRNDKNSEEEQDNSSGRTPWDILDSWYRQKP